MRGGRTLRTLWIIFIVWIIHLEVKVNFSELIMWCGRWVASPPCTLWSMGFRYSCDKDRMRMRLFGSSRRPVLRKTDFPKFWRPDPNYSAQPALTVYNRYLELYLLWSLWAFLSQWKPLAVIKMNKERLTIYVCTNCERKDWSLTLN